MKVNVFGVVITLMAVAIGDVIIIHIAIRGIHVVIHKRRGRRSELVEGDEAGVLLGPRHEELVRGEGGRGGGGGLVEGAALQEVERLVGGDEAGQVGHGRERRVQQCKSGEQVETAIEAQVLTDLNIQRYAWIH